MKKKDDRFYKIVVNRSDTNYFQSKEIKISKLHLRAVIVFAVMTATFISYTFSDLTRDAGYSQLAAQQLIKQSQLGIIKQSIKKFSPSQNGEGGPENYLDLNNKTISRNLYDKIHALEKMLGIRADVPSIYPVIGKINNEFGWRRNPFGAASSEHHAGMDIDGEKGKPIIAPAEGVVTKAGWQGGYGNLIEISHGNDLTTRYGHLSQIEIEVGDAVTRGQQIGRVGSTGRSTGPHLHYEVRISDKPVNPRGYLPPEPAALLP